MTNNKAGKKRKSSINANRIDRIVINPISTFILNADVVRTIKPTIKIQVIECYDALWIKVQHNGLGVSNEEQKFIFEPFFTNTSSDNDTLDNDYEAGKRLSFSHFIITEQHRGQLAITSDMNVGTTFHIQLPLE